jgi:molybdopterin converting factor small subunit
VKVQVHLHTILQKSTPEGMIRKFEVEIENGATLGDLVALLELSADDENTLFVVQGQISTMNCELVHGDVVHCIPAISGGGIMA